MNLHRMAGRLRGPVLAIVAGAGLVAFEAPPSATVAPVLPGRASLAAVEHPQPALTQSGVAAPAAQPRSGGREQLRFGGDGGPAAARRPTPGRAATAAFAPLPRPPAQPETSAAQALLRAGRLSAPATAPPSFPL